MKNAKASVLLSPSLRAFANDGAESSVESLRIVSIQVRMGMREMEEGSIKA